MIIGQFRLFGEPHSDAGSIEIDRGEAAMSESKEEENSDRHHGDRH